MFVIPISTCPTTAEGTRPFGAAEHAGRVTEGAASPALRDHQLPLGEDSTGADLRRTGIEFRAENTGDTATKNKPALRDAVGDICSCSFRGCLGAGLQVILKPSSSTGKIF